MWKCLGQYQLYNVNMKRCLLRLNEMLQIAFYRGSNMLSKQTEIISKWGTGTYAPWQVMIAWTWNFCSLRESGLLSLGSKFTETLSISINFKSKCILWYVQSTPGVTMDKFHQRKGDFHILYTVTSFEKPNYYIVVYLIVIVHSAEDS